MTFCHNFLMMEPIAVRLKRAGRAGPAEAAAALARLIKGAFFLY